MQGLCALLIVCGVLAATCPGALAKPKNCLYKNHGQQRALQQQVINDLHPTGQTRAAAEHAVNNLTPNNVKAKKNCGWGKVKNKCKF
jgi:hypothetical protein